MYKFKQLYLPLLVSAAMNIGNIHASAAAGNDPRDCAAGGVYSASSSLSEAAAPATRTKGDFLTDETQSEFCKVIDKFMASNEKYRFVQQFTTDLASDELYNEAKVKFQELLKIPLVMQHINRTSNSVTFDDHGPTGCSEQEIWLCRALQELLVWTYRGCVGNPPHKDGGFYDSGVREVEPIFRPSLRNINSSVMLMGVQPRHSYYDVYMTRQAIDKFDMQGFIANSLTIPKPLGIRVWIAPNGKDDHAYMFVHILDESRTRVMASIFINSFSNSSYFEYINERFSMKAYYSADQINVNDSQLKHLKLEGGSGSVRVQRKVPLIDASHNIQTAEGDNSCAIYSNNFCLAVGNMMADTSIASRVFRLAETIENQVINANDPMTSINELKAIFQSDLKAFLPQYYSTDSTVRTEAELKAFNMRQRWDLSNARIAMFAEIGE